MAEDFSEETGYPNENVLGGSRDMLLTIRDNDEGLEEVARLQISTTTGFLNLANDPGTTSDVELTYLPPLSIPEFELFNGLFIPELELRGYDRFELKFGSVDQDGGFVFFAVLDEVMGSPSFVAIEISENETIPISFNFLKEQNLFLEFFPIGLIGIQIGSNTKAFDTTLDSITIEGEETITIEPKSTPESISLWSFFILSGLGITSVLQNQLKH